MARNNRNKLEQTRKGRVSDTKKERSRVIIACEGTKTEPNYFRSLVSFLIIDRKIANSSLVIAPHQHTDPKGVLEDLKRHLAKDSDFEYKWIVIDKDEVPAGDFNDVFNSAKAANIGVAYSNPCFELWFLLHFEYRDTAIEAKECIDKLKTHLEDYQKNSVNIYEQLKDRQEQAIENATRLENNKQEPPAENNPGTTVHTLVKLLINFCGNLNSDSSRTI